MKKSTKAALIISGICAAGGTACVIAGMVLGASWTDVRSSFEDSVDIDHLPWRGYDPDDDDWEDRLERDDNCLLYTSNRAFEELLARYELPLESENPVGELPGDFRIRVIGGEELVCAEVESQVNRALQKEKMEQFDREKVYDPPFRQALEERFSYQYPHQGDREIPVKLTVSQLKGREPEEDPESISLYPDPVTPAVPAFLQKEETLKGADRGTAYHLSLIHI